MESDPLNYKIKNKMLGTKFDPRATKRKETTLTHDDIDTMARMFFVDNASLDEISSAVKVSNFEANQVLNGNNFSMLWGRAVTDLLCTGVDCTRKVTGHIPFKQRVSGTLTKAEVLEVRTRYLDGQKQVDIASEMELSKSKVSKVCLSKAYTRHGWYPDGWSFGEMNDGTKD
jgi:hypothetical protein